MNESNGQILIESVFLVRESVWPFLNDLVRQKIYEYTNDNSSLLLLYQKKKDDKS